MHSDSELRAFEQEQEEDLQHEGKSLASGRFPLGSGEHPFEREGNLSKTVARLKKTMREEQIAKHLQFKNTSDLRAHLAQANAMRKASERAIVFELKKKGLSNTAIAKRVFKDPKKESTVRNILNREPSRKDRLFEETKNALKAELEKHPFLDVGEGVELNYNGVTQDRMKKVLLSLEKEGYKLHSHIQVDQYGSKDPSKKTTVKVLTKEGVTDREVYQNLGEIKPAGFFLDHDADKVRQFEPPRSVDPSRVYIRYNENGGLDKDGTIELRRGVDDISLGRAHYAQVRIAVGGTHYLKGMALYSDNMPDGYDIVFNTNKHRGTPMLGPKDNSVLKPLNKTKDGEIDISNPFKAAIKTEKDLGLSYEGDPDATRLVRQRHYIDSEGNEQLSCINIVNEEGSWNKWSHNISSQMLSKQPPAIAKKQLDLTYQMKRETLNDILNIPNPTVRKKLLEGFADQCDSDAVDLDAYGFPNQVSKVMLPVTTLSDNECYCPTLTTGTTVALIRYPHASISEIAYLTVNNEHKDSKAILGTGKDAALDAIGVSKHTLDKLSGADCDGDTCVVIPFPEIHGIQWRETFEKMKGFEPKEAYPGYEGMKRLTKERQQNEMGVITNLIVDMGVAHATEEEMVRAMKHSMVIIDAEKHGLDYKRSERENGILELKRKYQKHADDDGFGGASSLISRAGGETRINQQRFKGVDKETGKKIFEPTWKLTWKGEQALRTVLANKFGDEVANGFNAKDFRESDSDVYRFAREYADQKKLLKQTVTTRMAVTDDARTLISKYNTMTERVYADYANKMKAMALKARKEMVNTPRMQRDPEAAKLYEAEVRSLTTKLRTAQRNKPLERMSLVLANVKVRQDMEDDPELRNNKADLKKLKGRTLTRMRERTGANKQKVFFTEDEWKAVQAHAVSDSFLRSLLDNSDDKHIKEIASPREKRTISSAKASSIRNCLQNGYNLAEIAKMFDVSVSAVQTIAAESR